MLVGNFWEGRFCDIAKVVGAHIVSPKGIRDPEEWIARYRRKILVKGVKEYTEKILLHIPELYLGFIEGGEGK